MKKPEWQKIDPKQYADSVSIVAAAVLPVIGGWLLETLHDTSARVDEFGQAVSMTFLPDPNHETLWETLPRKEEDDNERI